MATPLQIDPELDPAAMARAFASFGRLHVPAFLTPESAQAATAAVARPPTWYVASQQGGQTRDIELPVFEAAAPEQLDRFYGDAYAAARSGFQFIYERYPLSLQIDNGVDVGPGLRALYDFLNGPAFLGFVKRLTGDPGPTFADAQLSRYRVGHFLTAHNDENPEAARLYAYVLNLTPGWRVDWGGLLLFMDEDGHVAEGYTPAYNALNIFRVPARHAVSVVAPFAGGDRLSVTGWIRRRPSG